MSYNLNFLQRSHFHREVGVESFVYLQEADCYLPCPCTDDTWNSSQIADGVWMFSGRCRLQSYGGEQQNEHEKKAWFKLRFSFALLHGPAFLNFSQNVKTEEKVSNRNLTKCAQKYKCLKIQFPISFKIRSLLNKYKVQHTSRHGYKTKVSEHSPCSSCPATQSRFPTERFIRDW